ncbi:MAG: hypothetical protein EOO15_04480 [Chitinophagaceae bacterium]|nr:MAG: hypothetical protein EOO15_04480 [Chitinophagaceae bacterium]
MNNYLNVGRKSGVRAYQVGVDYIDVMFSDRSLYRYDYSVAGMAHVQEMKRLASLGSGLNSYINRFVKFKYTARLN